MVYDNTNLKLNSTFLRFRVKLCVAVLVSRLYGGGGGVIGCPSSVISYDLGTNFKNISLYTWHKREEPQCHQLLSSNCVLYE